ncbi:MAG TPA: hypothetical protein VHX13_06050 [Acidobacteriaceae bacterium]|jgi:hypothetical protein|nr:hypothetical protein [Acidobacteriaceae bacterium]
MTESDFGADVTNKLREQYFLLLPKIRLLTTRLEVEIQYHVRNIAQELDPYEQVIVKSRVKDCEGAIRKLRGEGNVFTPEKTYSLTDLKDLAAVRVLVFPSKRLTQIDELLRTFEPFRRWSPDPLKYAGGSREAPKYYGTFDEVGGELQGEYQILPILIGNFLEVEHSAMYKPVGWAKGADRDEVLKVLRTDIEKLLIQFEKRFDDFVEQNRQSSQKPR